MPNFDNIDDTIVYFFNSIVVHANYTHDKEFMEKRLKTMDEILEDTENAVTWFYAFSNALLEAENDAKE